MKSIIRIIASITLAFLPLLVFVPGAGAINGNISQQILPLECVFEIVNDGSNTIIYLTPEECGVVIPPEPPVDPTDPTPPTTPGEPTRQPTVVDTGNGIIVIPGTIQPVQNATSSEIARLLPFRQVATIETTEEASLQQEEILAAVPGTAIVVAVSAIGLIVLVALV